MTTPAQIAELRAANDIDDEAKTGKISHDEARAMLSRFINSHFKNAGEHARASIPVDFTRDDDVRMTAYIVQMRKRDATIDALTAERDHWKANHDNQVRVKQSILDRPDLQDRAKKVQDIIAERDRYRVALELLATRLEIDARASIAEASRIRSAVKTNTDAEERCVLRANLWRDCAMHIRNAVNEPTPPAEGGRV